MKYKGSEKSKDMDNTQETFKKGSSETTRAAYDNNFLEWLIGFTEGDGSFIVNKQGTLEYKITQSSKDAAILFYIKKTLGFGTVSVQSKVSKTHHFRVRDKEGLSKIIDIFNGYLQLNKCKKRFELFIIAYNLHYNVNIDYNRKFIDLISLNSAWLCGFTDAEGCFTVSVIKYEFREYPLVQVRYILSQQDEKELLDKIAILLNGRVSYQKSYNGHNMAVQLTYLKIVIFYFSKFKLKTFKYISYLKWKKIYNLVILKKHRESNDILQKIILWSKDINCH